VYVPVCFWREDALVYVYQWSQPKTPESPEIKKENVLACRASQLLVRASLHLSYSLAMKVLHFRSPHDLVHCVLSPLLFVALKLFHSSSVVELRFHSSSASFRRGCFKAITRGPLLLGYPPVGKKRFAFRSFLPGIVLWLLQLI
jgi:hypothetical protein